MSWWNPSWLLNFPSVEFSLPTSIQRRFLSFLLNRFLGHFVKPGQLDVQNIDSQIGSGYVQVKEIQLDPAAFNDFLVGLPIELHHGTVGTATARIPWPNPLTSRLGLSVQSLHLVFHFVPVVSSRNPSSVTNIADSVASVAETFIHQELSPGEEATLRESFHPELLDSIYSSHDNIPGGLDPFISTEVEQHSSDEDPHGISIFASLIESLLARFSFDATDVQVTIINPGHASFTLTIPEISYETHSRTRSASDSANSQAENVKYDSSEQKIQETGLTVTIKGVKLISRDLRLFTPGPASPKSHCTESSTLSTKPDRLPAQRCSPPTLSSSQSDSDIDEETQILMSTSIACLPPRLPEPSSTLLSSSVSSSMYHSAVSVLEPGSVSNMEGLRPILPTFPDNSSIDKDSPGLQSSEPSTEEHPHDLIVSFGSEPIIIQLTTPFPIAKSPIAVPASLATTSEVPTSKSGSDRAKSSDTLHLTMQCPIIMFAFRARHLRDLLDISDAWNRHTKSQRKEPNAPSSEPSVLHKLDVTVRVRGAVALLLPSGLGGRRYTPQNEEDLAQFFEHPLVPPSLRHGYVRIHVDGIAASMGTVRSSKARSTGAQRITTNVSVSLTDISVFAFSIDPTVSSSSSLPKHIASPIFITDANLPTQYPLEHSQPQFGDPSRAFSFDIVDWTHPSHRTSAPKPSIWRTKVPKQHSHNRMSSVGRPGSVAVPGLSSSPGKFGTDLLQTPIQTHKHALVVNLKTVSTTDSKSKQESGTRVHTEVKTVAFHVFVDLQSLLSGRDAELLAFIDELMTVSSSNQYVPPDRSESSDESEDRCDGDMSTPPATPRVYQDSGLRHREEESVKERHRLERLVLEDLNLTLDYFPEPVKKPSTTTVKSRQKKQVASDKDDKLRLTLKIPMIRLEVRCPPPQNAAGPRSGSLVIDVHNIQFSPGAHFENKKSTARFTEDFVHGRPNAQVPSGGTNALFWLELGRVVVAYAFSGETKANMIVSVGPFPSSQTSKLASSQFGTRPSSTETVSSAPSRFPSIIVSQTPRSRFSSDSPRPSGTVVAVDVPCVYANLTKPLVDGLQLWADDMTQLLDRTFWEQNKACDMDNPNSRNSSIVGSRFFVKSRSGSGSETASSLNNDHVGETIFKISVSEAFFWLSMLRNAEAVGTIRPFNMWASELDCLVELKVEGKDENVVTLGLQDVVIKDISKTGETTSLLAPTSLRNNISNPRPLVKLRFTSLIVPGSASAAKESRIKVFMHGFTSHLSADFDWATDLGVFFKAPPGAFESVIPSERTRIAVNITEGSVAIHPTNYSEDLIIHTGETSFSTEIVGEAPGSTFSLSVPDLSILLVDDIQTSSEVKEGVNMKIVEAQGADLWKAAGYALIARVGDLDMLCTKSNNIENTRVTVKQGDLSVHLCADTLSAFTSFISHLTPVSKSSVDEKSGPRKTNRGPTTILEPAKSKKGLMSSLDENAFNALPEVGATPDMIQDDLPSNADYLDESYGAAAGFRDLRDDDLDEFDAGDIPVSSNFMSGVISSIGGETIRVLTEGGIHPVEHYFDTLPPDSGDDASHFGKTSMRVRIHNLNVRVLLYDGYDWDRTRKAIEDQVKVMRRRLEKIRQLLASGQTHDPETEETSTLLFNSVYIGLEQDVDGMEPRALIAAIDDELENELETASQSSWQSLRPSPSQPYTKTRTPSWKTRSRNLKRSKGSYVEFLLKSANGEIDHYLPHESMTSRTLITVRDLEILDHIKTSTWRTFLTELRSDSRGNIRETGSNMVRIELRDVKPVPSLSSVESRLRAKFLPLRLHVDQDALDFMKKFFSFRDSQADEQVDDSSSDGPYFQQAEVFPVDIKLDYKPRRVDYRALREGRTIELMNFFHFDGAEMTLRHITLSGITGWPRLFELLNDLWTPDVKATQLVDVISGVSPIRSVVNVGSGVADLVLLPIAQYKKDGRVLRGVQKGATSFVRSTAMEAIKLGAKLATGTQVILEQAENVLGTQFKDPVLAETLQLSPGSTVNEINLAEDDEAQELISKYAEQPQDVKEGLQSAYKSLRRNMNSAAQTILAVPMEVYERSNQEGPVRAVIRAVPIAVLRPMIGASEAVSQTLLGLHNTMDPNLHQENETKYKQR